MGEGASGTASARKDECQVLVALSRLASLGVGDRGCEQDLQRLLGMMEQVFIWHRPSRLCL